jgi:hypothetical protein
MPSVISAVRGVQTWRARGARLDLFPPSFLYCAMPTGCSAPRMFYRSFLWILFMALMVGCAGKTIQYKEDHDRIVRIDQAVESLRKAYVERDRSGVEALLLPSGNLDQLQREMYSDFDTFRDIQLELAIERILIEGDNIDVFVHWQGQWKRTPEDAGTRQRGHGRLAWVGTQSILLREAQGDLPFGMSTRVGDEPARARPNS